jgi:hypothetical protein
MASVVISGDTSGSVTITAPAVAGTPTLTLPTTTDTLVGKATTDTLTNKTLTSPTISTINLTGGQIAFPATQSASADANTLDDYEEGTWTPTITFGGGSTGMVYASQKGNYTKVGNRVFISAYVATSTKGSSTGGLTINGLPFTSVNISDQYNCTAVWTNTLSSIVGQVIAYNPPNSTAISSIGYLGTGAITGITATNWNNNSDFMINFNYQI